MNKIELITAMAAKAEMNKKETEKALNAFMAVISEALAANDKVSLIGFGTFETVERKARMGRNPKTNEEMPIPGGRVPKFKAGKSLRDLVRGYR